MKRIIITLFTLLLLAPLEAKDLKVALSKSNSTEITFLENYAIVINKEYYYGPISKDFRLQIAIVEGKFNIALIERDENGKELYAPINIAKTPGKIDIIRGFDNDISFEETIDPQRAIRQPIFAEEINLSKEAQKTTPFFKFKPRSSSGEIEFTGPLSLTIRKTQDSFNLIETIPLEDYLVHVTNCEMRQANNSEAYKAQTILERTFVYNKLNERLDENNKNRSNWLDFQLFADTRDQAYICDFRVNNKTLPDQKIKDAVKATESLVLGDINKRLIEVHYCASCGKCSYCQANGVCHTKNGLGDCQKGIAYYSKQPGYDYVKVLKKYHPSAIIFSYTNGSLAFSDIHAQEDIEKSLSDMEDKLKQMI